MRLSCTASDTNFRVRCSSKLVSLAVLGSVNWDINLFIDRFAEVGAEVSVKQILEVPGGKGGNVAVAAARILGPKQATVIGGLGRDELAQMQIKILKQEGVETSGLKRMSEVISGRAYIVIDRNGGKMIHTLFKANLRLNPDDIEEPHISRLIKQAQIIVIIDPKKETIIRASEMSKSLGKTVIFSPATRCSEGLKELSEAIRNSDYIVVNQFELKCLTGKEKIVDAKNALLEINPDVKIIATLGKKGAVMMHKHGQNKIQGVDPSRFGLKVVNTTGCGDAFLGVFCASKIQGYSDEESARRGNLAGAIKAARQETRGSPTAEELESYLKMLQQ